MGVRKKTIIFLLSAVAVFTGCEHKAPLRKLAVAFYNCENFFDTIHNPAKHDEEFTPAGKCRYTQKVYEQKLHNIATVIQSMGGDDGPAIIGLAEIENNTVLRDLVHQPEIARRKYQFIWFDGPDERGINVAMLYDPAYFRPLQSEPLHVALDSVKPVIAGSKLNTRDVLHVYGVLAGDTIHLFINHWPSRAEGDEQSRPKRIAAALVVKNAIDTLIARDPGSKIIVMGDFNDNPADSSIAAVLNASGERKRKALYNPFAAIYNAGSGTEVYGHAWNLFDQVIVSEGFLNNRMGKLHYDSAGIYKPDFLVDHYKGHEGEPCRAYLGTYWLNGYSDHFPVVISFKNVQ